MKKALVFGANGYIGSHVTQSLLEAGYQVGAVIRSAADHSFLASLDVTLHTIDTFTDERLVPLMQSYNLVYNCTADITPNRSLQQYNETQVTLSKTLAHAAHRAGIQRFLQLSTVEVYGEKAALTDESHALKPKFAFQQSCVDRENVLQQVAASTGLEVVILRPTSTFGLRSSFVEMLLNGHAKGTVQVIGSGLNKFSSVDTRDIGRAFAFLGQLDSPEKVYLLRGYEQSYLDIKNVLDDLTATKSRIQSLPVFIAYPLAMILELITPKSKIPFITRFIVSVASFPGLYNDQKIRRAGFETMYTLRDTFSHILDQQMIKGNVTEQAPQAMVAQK